VEHWLKAPMQTADGALMELTRGTPQDGVVSPLLANLFLHYAFAVWITRNLRSVRFPTHLNLAARRLHARTIQLRFPG
jgi:RNA-directed DNA polymerase